MARLALLLLAGTSVTATTRGESATAENFSTLSAPTAIQIDLDHRSASVIENGEIRRRRIEDCSTETLSCVRSVCEIDGKSAQTRPDCEPGDELALIWPRDCARHFERGHVIEGAGIKARFVGYYDRIIHHTGLRNRDVVFVIEGKPHLALLVSKGKLRGFLVDTLEQGQIARWFKSSPVFDATDVDGPGSPGLIMARIVPSSIGEACER